MPGPFPAADVAAIRDIAHRYVRALDTRDVTLLRSCYHEGAFEDHNEYQGDVDGFCRHLLASAESTQSTIQTVLAVDVRVEGDRAEARTSCIAVIRTRATAARPRPKRITVELEYVDRLERRAGRWASVHRVCIPGHVRSLENLPPA
jgi:hypothetical protein